ncbi:hypothetical protein, partial [Streptomyces viridochromogenes]|uniref:hypothetical protein n=1 Tax=Streptomyces viridochromogenes TaxID=1938 RepID=UPI0006C24FBB
RRVQHQQCDEPAAQQQHDQQDERCPGGLCPAGGKQLREAGALWAGMLRGPATAVVSRTPVIAQRVIGCMV